MEMVADMLHAQMNVPAKVLVVKMIYVIAMLVTPAWIALDVNA
jgi:hypothetical protein